MPLLAIYMPVVLVLSNLVRFLNREVCGGFQFHFLSLGQLLWSYDIIKLLVASGTINCSKRSGLPQQYLHFRQMVDGHGRIHEFALLEQTKRVQLSPIPVRRGGGPHVKTMRLIQKASWLCVHCLQILATANESLELVIQRGQHHAALQVLVDSVGNNNYYAARVLSYCIMHVLQLYNTLYVPQCQM